MHIAGRTHTRSHSRPRFRNLVARRRSRSAARRGIGATLAQPSCRHPAVAAERAAIAALDDLVRGQSVELAFSGRRSDRYGRLLAHVFLRRGGERVWVQGELLSSGHARAYGLPGSLACMPNFWPAKALHE